MQPASIDQVLALCGYIHTALACALWRQQHKSPAALQPPGAVAAIRMSRKLTPPTAEPSSSAQPPTASRQQQPVRGTDEGSGRSRFQLLQASVLLVAALSTVGCITRNLVLLSVLSAGWRWMVPIKCFATLPIVLLPWTLTSPGTGTATKFPLLLCSVMGALPSTCLQLFKHQQLTVSGVRACILHWEFVELVQRVAALIALSTMLMVTARRQLSSMQPTNPSTAAQHPGRGDAYNPGQMEVGDCRGSSSSAAQARNCTLDHPPRSGEGLFSLAAGSFASVVGAVAAPPNPLGQDNPSGALDMAPPSAASAVTAVPATPDQGRPGIPAQQPSSSFGSSSTTSGVSCAVTAPSLDTPGIAGRMLLVDLFVPGVVAAPTTSRPHSYPAAAAAGPASGAASSALACGVTSVSSGGALPGAGDVAALGVPAAAAAVQTAPSHSVAQQQMAVAGGTGGGATAAGVHAASGRSGTPELHSSPDEVQPPLPHNQSSQQQLQPPRLHLSMCTQLQAPEQQRRRYKAPSSSSLSFTGAASPFASRAGEPGAADSSLNSPVPSTPRAAVMPVARTALAGMSATPLGAGAAAAGLLVGRPKPQPDAGPAELLATDPPADSAGSPRPVLQGTFDQSNFGTRQPQPPLFVGATHSAATVLPAPAASPPPAAPGPSGATAVQLQWPSAAASGPLYRSAMQHTLISLKVPLSYGLITATAIQEAARQAAQEAAAAAGGLPVHASVVAIQGCIQLLGSLATLAMVGGSGIADAGAGDRYVQAQPVPPVAAQQQPADGADPQVGPAQTPGPQPAAAAAATGQQDAPGMLLGNAAEVTGQLDPDVFAQIFSSKLQQLAKQPQHQELARLSLQQLQVHMQVHGQEYVITFDASGNAAATAAAGTAAAPQLQQLPAAGSSAARPPAAATMGPSVVLEGGSWVWPLCLPLDERPSPGAAGPTATPADVVTAPGQHLQQQQQQQRGVPVERAQLFHQAVTVHGLKVAVVRVVVACGDSTILDTVQQVAAGCVRVQVPLKRRVCSCYLYCFVHQQHPSNPAAPSSSTRAGSTPAASATPTVLVHVPLLFMPAPAVYDIHNAFREVLLDTAAQQQQQVPRVLRGPLSAIQPMTPMSSTAAGSQWTSGQPPSISDATLPTVPHTLGATEGGQQVSPGSAAVQGWLDWPQAGEGDPGAAVPAAAPSAPSAAGGIAATAASAVRTSAASHYHEFWDEDLPSHTPQPQQAEVPVAQQQQQQGQAPAAGSAPSFSSASSPEVLAMLQQQLSRHLPASGAAAGAAELDQLNLHGRLFQGGDVHAAEQQVLVPVLQDLGLVLSGPCLGLQSAAAAGVLTSVAQSLAEWLLLMGCYDCCALLLRRLLALGVPLVLGEQEVHAADAEDGRVLQMLLFGTAPDASAQNVVANRVMDPARLPAAGMHTAATAPSRTGPATAAAGPSGGPHNARPTPGDLPDAAGSTQQSAQPTIQRLPAAAHEPATSGTTRLQSPSKFMGALLGKAGHAGKAAGAAGGSGRAQLSSGQLLAGESSSRQPAVPGSGVVGGVVDEGPSGHSPGHTSAERPAGRAKGWRSVVQDSAEAFHNLLRGRRKPPR